MYLSKLKSKISKLSQNPGVYIFKDKSGKILYVGKATNLNSRIQSYFSKNKKAERLIEAMIHEVADAEVIQTESVLEALILESDLIKKLQPKYNAMGKDDKSFSYFAITKEAFPRILIFRATDIDFNKLQAKNYKLEATYGPYTSKKHMEIALKIIRKIFPFHSNKQQTEKGCLDFQLGRCPGPYAGAISREDYKKNVRDIKMILKGKKRILVKKMEREMKKFSKLREFEKAAELRNKIFSLNHIQDIALVSNDSENNFKISRKKFRIEAFDISNISGQYAVGSMAVFIGAVPDKSQYRKFRIKTIKNSDDIGMMEEILLRRFKNDWMQPDMIFLDGGKGHANMAYRLLRKLGLQIPAIAVAKGKTRKKLDFKFSTPDLFSVIRSPKGFRGIMNDKKLVKHIMDEAHRFAIRYHKKIRKNNLFD